MPTATRTRPRPRKRARRVDARPTLGVCQCGAQVLTLHAPGPIVCEPREATPAFDCPSCENVELHGHRRREACHRCHGTKRLGIEGPLPAGVALDEFDRGRFYAEGQLREAGEGVYALHVCPQVATGDHAAA